MPVRTICILPLMIGYRFVTDLDGKAVESKNFKDKWYLEINPPGKTNTKALEYTPKIK